MRESPEVNVPENTTENTSPNRPFGRTLSDLWLDGEEGKLHPAERKLLECAAQGKVCILGDERPSKPSASNAVRAELLRFIALCGDSNNPLHQRGVELVGAFIQCGLKGLDFTGCTIPENLYLVRCTIDGHLTLQDTLFETLGLDGSSLEALYGDRCEATGSLVMRNGFSAIGIVRLAGAKIGGDLVCSNADFEESNTSLFCDGIQTKGSVFLNNSFSATGTVRLIGAKIDGNLDCSNARFTGAGIALLSDGMETKGAVFLCNGFNASGTVRLLGAKIGGYLECQNARFEGTDIALHCDRLQTNGNVVLSESFIATGMVRLLGAKIDGNLDCGKGAFLGEPASLIVQGANVGGTLFLNDGFLALGTVDLLNVKIGDNFDCEHATFSSKDVSLFAKRITVGGDTIMGKECRAAGQVSFQSATIGGDVTFQGGSFEGKPAISLKNANIGGTLIWRGVEYAKGELNLAGASCLTLNMDWKSWGQPEQIRLDSFTYKGFSELPKGCDAQFWKSWLERQPENHLNEKFRPNPYSQLADVLKRMGHEQEAVSVLVEQRKRQSAFTRLYEPVSNNDTGHLVRRLVIFWNFMQGLVVDYGYRPGKALLYLFGIVIAGAVIYQIAAFNGIMTPTHPLIFKEAGLSIPERCARNWVYPGSLVKDPVVGQSITDECEAKLPSEHSTFNALIYSADVALPIVNFRMEVDWAPRVVNWKTGEAPGFLHMPPWGWGWWVRTWEWVQIALGWLLSLLFASAIGGIIRR